ncbi:MAG: CHAP domain-containing protein [Ruminococcus sp.]|nr:CHAP domain-containing protein [Ruminococcus sp.]
MNDKNLAVLTNVIGAVESGGQVYGKRRYDAYDDPYKNSPKEHTITIGWYQAYGHEARQLIQAIHDATPALFERLDSAGVGGMLSKDWVAIKWKPTTAQKNVILALIDSTVGHAVQDRIFADKMKALIADCARDYTKDIKAQMMYCEIRHLGGKGPCDRIFRRCNGDYSLDRIMTALVQDQRDATSDNQVGDTRYWSRHVKCRQFIDQYAVDESIKKKGEGMTEAQAIDRVIAIAEAEVGYHEKASGDLKYLYDKKANSGDANYTKYNYEMHKIQPKNMDFPGAWCDCFCDWVFKESFGIEVAKKVLCGGFDDYTPNSSNLYKKAGRWTEEPKRGYQAFFKNSQRICHTGIVYKVEGNKIYTIEGNAGNEVRKKSYTLGDNYIAGFGMPLYSAAADVPAPSYAEKVKLFQKWLNANYAQILKTANVGPLVVDGDYGKKTRAAALAVWKYMANKYYGADLTVGNVNFFGACKQVAAKMTDKEIEKHYSLQEIKNGILAGRGFESVKEFQKSSGLKDTGKMNADTWYALFN